MGIDSVHLRQSFIGTSACRPIGSPRLFTLGEHRVCFEPSRHIKAAPLLLPMPMPSAVKTASIRHLAARVAAAQTMQIRNALNPPEPSRSLPGLLADKPSSPPGRIATFRLGPGGAHSH